MSLQLIGLNHKTAPLEIREKLSFDEQNCVSGLRSLVDGACVFEGLILSTCNRVEILLEGKSDSAFSHVVDFLAASKDLSPEIFTPHLYHFSNEDAVRHLFRVASSLDSMILGETQILRQVRDAYSRAIEAGTARRTIHKLLHHTFRSAKRVRNETRICSLPVSVSSAAVEKALQLFGSLADKTILLIGAGEMAELAAKHLVSKGARKILLCNRTTQNALKLANEFGGIVVDFEKLETVLPEADVIICSTSAPDFLISQEIAVKSQNAKQKRPTLFIDISVPRNVCPRVSEIENVFLYDVDDLQSVISANFEARRREAVAAERIISEGTTEFWEYLRTLERGEMLGLLRKKMQEAARSEFELHRSRFRGLTSEQEAAIEQLLLRTVNKIAHPILYGLRHSRESGATEFAEILCAMLGSEDVESIMESK